jgi:hypothetical protein
LLFFVTRPFLSITLTKMCILYIQSSEIPTISSIKVHTYFYVLLFFALFWCFQWMIRAILIVNRWFVKRCLELERKRCHGVTVKLIDYEFTMVPATQFVSGSGI